MKTLTPEIMKYCLLNNTRVTYDSTYCGENDVALRNIKTIDLSSGLVSFLERNNFSIIFDDVFERGSKRRNSNAPFYVTDVSPNPGEPAILKIGDIISNSDHTTQSPWYMEYNPYMDGLLYVAIEEGETMCTIERHGFDIGYSDVVSHISAADFGRVRREINDRYANALFSSEGMC